MQATDPATRRLSRHPSPQKHHALRCIENGKLTNLVRTSIAETDPNGRFPTWLAKNYSSKATAEAATTLSTRYEQLPEVEDPHEICDAFHGQSWSEDVNTHRIENDQF